MTGELPEHADNAQTVYTAAVRAWREVNRKLLIGAGEDAQIGHGILMREARPQPIPLKPSVT